jgi:type II secretory ATPase GspE/PulE/Tfp pilus assembly ATPase PilB-like protein
MDDTLRQAVLDNRPIGELRRIIARTHSDLAADAERILNQGRTTRDEIRRVLGRLALND